MSQRITAFGGRRGTRTPDLFGAVSAEITDNALPTELFFRVGRIPNPYLYYAIYYGCYY